jgi:hypothetical protein
VIRGLHFRSGLRIGRALLVASFAASASVLADGSGGGASAMLMSGPALASEVEGALVRAIVGLRQSGLRQAMGEIDKALEHSPNYKLAHLVRGDMLMARAGKPVAFASVSAAPDAEAPFQDEARVRLQRYLHAPRVDDLPAVVLQMAPSQWSDFAPPRGSTSSSPICECPASMACNYSRFSAMRIRSCRRERS